MGIQEPISEEHRVATGLRPSLRDPVISDEARRWASKLLREGFCRITDLLPAETIAALDADLAGDFADAPFCSGPFYGEHTQRLGGLLARAPRIAQLVQHDLVLEIVNAVLRPWCESVQLSLTQAIALHPGALAQIPHRDQELWGGEKGRLEYSVSVMWPLSDYCEQNGGTLFWPESHGKKAVISATSNPVSPCCSPGSALVFLGSTQHGAGCNLSDRQRRGILVSYCLGWLKPFENQWLVYPPSVAKGFSSDLAALVGYRQHRPNLGNVEGKSPSHLLRSSDAADRGATDALRPEQVFLVARHAARQ